MEREIPLLFSIAIHDATSVDDFLPLLHPEIALQGLDDYREQFKEAEYNTRKNEINYNILLKFSPAQLPNLSVEIEGEDVPQDRKDVRKIVSDGNNQVVMGISNPAIVENPIGSARPQIEEKKRQSLYNMPAPMKDYTIELHYQGGCDVAGEYGDANDKDKLTHLTEIASDNTLRDYANALTFTCWDTELKQTDYTIPWDDPVE
jgi:hypothetical protein